MQPQVCAWGPLQVWILAWIRIWTGPKDAPDPLLILTAIAPDTCEQAPLRGGHTLLSSNSCCREPSLKRVFLLNASSTSTWYWLGIGLLQPPVQQCERKQHKEPISSSAEKKHADRRRELSVRERSSPLPCFSFHCLVPGWNGSKTTWAQMKWISPSDC